MTRPVSDVPDGWRSCKLGEVAVLGGGTTPSRAIEAYWFDATIPWATPSDITSLPVGVSSISETENRVSERAWSECSLPLNPPGTVLMTSRATIGFAAINAVPMTTNQGFITFKAGEGLDPAFLLHWLTASRPDLVAAAGGSTFKELSRGTAKLLPILLPPLREQRRIAEVLRSVDEAIANTRAVHDAAVSTQHATFTAFLRRGDHSSESVAVEDWTTGRIAGVERLPKGWRVARLVNVARLESGHTPDRKKTDYWNNGDVEWLSLHDTKNLEQADISRTELRITEAGLANSSARLLPAGTVCFSRTATVGKCVIMAKSMATSQDFANFVCSPEINNRYLLHLMRWMQPVWKALASGSTHQTIYMPTFKALQIVLPARVDQDAIAETMDGFVEAIDGYTKELERLQVTKSSLMSDLLSGRVRVPALVSATSQKTVPPAFKRAVFAAEVVHQLHNDIRFGSVKHEKIVHLCELHLDLHGELDRHAYKEAAGPYDPKARRSVDGIFAKQKWFKAHKPDGKRVVYTPLEKCGAHKSYFDRYFGTRRPAMQPIIDLLRPLDTEQCEIVATLYAVWNDFLIDGIQPTDGTIVASVLQWHPKKATIAESRWLAALPWMRDRGLVPTGKGEKTRVAAK